VALIEKVRIGSDESPRTRANSSKLAVVVGGELSFTTEGHPPSTVNSSPPRERII
jgi:hypothetical protein